MLFSIQLFLLPRIDHVTYFGVLLCKFYYLRPKIKNVSFSVMSPIFFGLVGWQTFLFYKYPEKSMKIDFNIPKGINKFEYAQNIRVGRVTGNKRFIFLALDKERTPV